MRRDVLYGRFRGQSGRDVLALSFSASDPFLPFDNQFCCDAQRGATEVLLRDRSLAALFRFQIGRFDHSSPFLGLLGEVLSEFGGRSNKGKEPSSASRAFSFASARPGRNGAVSLWPIIPR